MTPSDPAVTMPTWPVGWRVVWVAETGSTNGDLVTAGIGGARDRTVLATDHQTAGRGRLDRRWEAPAGANLLVSLLLRDVPPMPHTITQRVALAAVAAVRSVAGVEATLKWPNDVLVGDRKLAGVLAQMSSSSFGPFVVVGIGINVGWSPPESARLGDEVAPTDLLHALLLAYDALPRDDAALAGLYRSNLGTIGQQVRIELPGEQFLVGRAIDVEPDGRLVVLDDCAISHRIDTGDVVHLRPAG